MPNNTNADTAAHNELAQHLEQSLNWPQYFVTGEGVNVHNFAPAYYKVEGPNGPVSYVTEHSGPYPATMYGFAMAAQSPSFRWCLQEETPFE